MSDRQSHLAPTFDITAFFGLHEGQHFDRKSLFDGPEGKKQPRDRRTVRDQVAEYVAAFANAEGGVLILGIEDDGTRTGHHYPEAALVEILRTPAARLAPAQAEGFRIEHEGKELLVFDVTAADGPVQVVGNGFPLRIGDRTVQASESQIQALKLHGMGESYEARPSRQTLADLDPQLLAKARAGAGLPGLTDEAYLLKRKLADARGRQTVLRRSAELLFAKDGADHPNAGVRVFRVIGTERRTGPEHNVEERPRIEGPLPEVLNEAFRVIDSLIRRPSRLVGNRFRPVPEYPEFSWKEAVLNAVAHRDYASEGRAVEVWLFDDRMEISSPGGLVPDASLDDLLALRRVHVSRNPRTVRALVDLGFMRDQGEGIPRIFAEMEGLFLPVPTIEASGREFRITLRNTPTLTAEDREFVAALGAEELTDQEFRALLEASRHGRVDNARIREITGVDTLTASRLLSRLRDRNLLTLHAAGSASYYDLTVPVSHGDSDDRPAKHTDASEASRSETTASTPIAQERVNTAGQLPLWDLAADSQTHNLEGETHKLAGQTHKLGGETHKHAAETHKLSRETHMLAAQAHSLPEALKQTIANLGRRPPQQVLRNVLVALCVVGPMTAAELSHLLGRKDPTWLRRHHLDPLVREGRLQLRHPATPKHPRQAYLAANPSLAERT